MGHEEGDSEEERKERKEKHKQRKEESKKRKKRREDENKGETRDECSGSENPRPPRDERGQGHVAVTIEDPSDTPSGKRESGGAPHRGRGRLRVRLDSLESAARRIRRHSEGAMSSRTRRGSEGNAGSRARRSSEGSVSSRTRRNSEGSVSSRARRSSEGSVGVRFRRESEESAGVCLEPRGPPSPVSPSHADVMVHWKLEMPQEDDPETSSEASLSPSPPPVRPPQRRPREDPAAVDGRRRPPSSPTDTGVFARTPNEEGKREKFRIIEVKRKSQTIPGEPRAKTCSRRTSYKLAVGSPDTQETEIV
nr:zinc finger CCCH domain-containing protein 18-like isoform X1 [Penaeus vannamei]